MSTSTTIRPHRAPRASRRRAASGQFAVIVAAIGFGLSPYFAARAFAAGIDPFAASFVRVAMLAVVLTPWVSRAVTWGRIALIVAAGGATSIFGFAGFFVALDRAPVAAATVVYYTYPVVVLVLSALVWRRRLTGWEAAVCLAVVGGVLIAVGPIGMSSALLLALAPAFLAPLGWAAYLLILSGPAAEMPTLPKVLAGACGGALALLPVALWVTGGRLMPVTGEAFTSMGLLTLCSLAIPAVLVTWGVSRAGERATAMIGSLEFAVAVAAGWFLLGDDVSSVQLCGVGIVLCAALYSAHRTRCSTVPCA